LVHDTAQEDPPLKLEPLMTFRAELRPPTAVGGGPFGARTIFDVSGGSFTGSRLRGKLLPSGGDWLLLDAGGVGRLDVRGTMQTDDGAHIYVQYFGVLVMNDTVTGALARGEETRFGDTYFMTQPRFETGDERYAWLNRLVAVGEGRVLPGAVEYRIFEVANG
jgi:hypothetical protein